MYKKIQKQIANTIKSGKFPDGLTPLEFNLSRYVFDKLRFTKKPCTVIQANIARFFKNGGFTVHLDNNNVNFIIYP